MICVSAINQLSTLTDVISEHKHCDVVDRLYCFGISHLRRGHKIFFPKWSMFEAAVYEMLTRVAWSFAMGWVVIACVKGHGGLVNKFLSWGVFQPLAKVSYMVYLTHLTVMNNLYAYTRTYEMESSHFNQVTMPMNDISTLIMMYFLSAVLFICWSHICDICNISGICVAVRGSLLQPSKAFARRYVLI